MRHLNPAFQIIDSLPHWVWQLDWWPPLLPRYARKPWLGAGPPQARVPLRKSFRWAILSFPRNAPAKIENLRRPSKTVNRTGRKQSKSANLSKLDAVGELNIAGSGTRHT